MSFLYIVKELKGILERKTFPSDWIESFHNEDVVNPYSSQKDDGFASFLSQKQTGVKKKNLTFQKAHVKWCTNFQAKIKMV